MCVPRIRLKSNASHKERIPTCFIFSLLQLNGDIGEITAALGVYDDLKEGSNGKQYFSSRASCSALVKLFPFQKDIFISHNTWQEYESMLKVMKYYEFDWHLTRNPGELNT